MSRTYRRNQHVPYEGKIFRDGVGQESWRYTPKWWVQMYMTKPRRRKDKAMCHYILRGGDPDALAWPVSGRKPHHYYW